MAATAVAYTGPASRDDSWALRRQTFGPFAAAGLANGTYPILVLDEVSDVEKVLVRNSTAGSAGTIQFRAAASGTAPGSGSVITGVEDVSSANIPADTIRELPITGNNTNLSAGTLICFTTASNVASVAGLMITIVTRKGGYQVNDLGEKVYLTQTNQT